MIPAWRAEEAGPHDSLIGLAEAVLRFLRACAGEGTVVLVLEDLHWADPETLTIIEYLADNLAAERVLCVATLRDEATPLALQLVRSLEARRVSMRLELAPLDEEQVGALVASCLGSSAAPHEVLRLAAQADGVPFMVEELLAAALSAGALVKDGGLWRVAGRLEGLVPGTFAESMRRRVGQLSEQCQEVLVAAAVLGRRFLWDLLPICTGLAPDKVLGALHEGVDAQVVSFDRADGSFRFRHALSREAVLAGLFSPELQALSRRALDAIESTHPDLDGDWGELAAQLAVSAGDRDRAAALLLELGRRALAGGALASAEAALDQARDLLPEAGPCSLDVDECLLHVLSLAGNHERAAQVGASLLARLTDEPEGARRRIDIQLRLARALVAAARWDEAHAILERAGGDSAAQDDELAARVDAVRAQAAVVPDPEKARAWAWAALEVAERLGLAEVACESLEVVGRSERLRDLAAAEAAFSRAHRLAEAHDLAVWRVRALQELGAIDMLRGRPSTGSSRLANSRSRRGRSRRQLLSMSK